MNVVGQLQAIQANKVVQAAMMDIQAGFSKYKRLNGLNNLSTPAKASFDLIEGTNITNALTIDGFTPTATAVTCNVLHVCKQLKSGAVIAYWRNPLTRWSLTNLYNPRNIYLMAVYIDPDGVDSTATNDAGQSVKLLVSMQGHFLTSTPWHWSQLATPRVVQQPNYFRLDK
jgi:hypothetical protein